MDYQNNVSESQSWTIVQIKWAVPFHLIVQVVRSHQGAPHDPLAPLDHPLLWALELQPHPGTVDKEKF